MTGLVGLGRGKIKIDVCTFGKRVAKENTRSKFMHRAKSNPWIAQTTKDTKV